LNTQLKQITYEQLLIVGVGLSLIIFYIGAYFFFSNEAYDRNFTRDMAVIGIVSTFAIVLSAKKYKLIWGIGGIITTIFTTSTLYYSTAFMNTGPAVIF